jgi:hypothetical protein
MDMPKSLITITPYVDGTASATFATGMKKQHQQTKRKPKRGKNSRLTRQYLQFFMPVVPVWQHDNDNFSLDQPSPLKWVPTETTYGISSMTCPT